MDTTDVVTEGAASLGRDQAQSLGRRLRGAVSMLLAVLALSGTVLVTGTEVAKADTTRCATYGVGIRWGVRNGSMCSTVRNGGSYVDTVTMNFGTTLWGIDAVCNPAMKIDVYDRWGNWQTWRAGPRLSGCYRAAFNWMPTMYVRTSFPSAYGGSIRVTLLNGNGGTVAATWHPLT